MRSLPVRQQADADHQDAFFVIEASPARLGDTVEHQFRVVGEFELVEEIIRPSSSRVTILCLRHVCSSVHRRSSQLHSHPHLLRRYLG